MSDERNSKILDVVNDNRPSSAPPTPGINPHEAVEWRTESILNTSMFYVFNWYALFFVFFFFNFF